ncbi:MAG: hypothetical protein KDE08_07475 [Rhodobacteraceae bacterium]|nr:hypothetical protein [Paracoccaceae bacterium]
MKQSRPTKGRFSKSHPNNFDISHVEEIGAYRDTRMFLAVKDDASGAKYRKLRMNARELAASD